MQFRAEIDDRGRTRIVRLAGRLESSQVSEVVRLVDETPVAAQLDLSDLVSADSTALEALALLEDRGTVLVGMSPYMALQLEIRRTSRTRTHPDVVAVRPGHAGPGTGTDDREDE